MKKLVVQLGLGVVLFGGSLVGALAATGRLNHDGVANIPLLNKLFPEPPPDPKTEKDKDKAKAGKEKGKEGAGDKAGDGKAADGKAAEGEPPAAPAGETAAKGEAADGKVGAHDGVPADASHAEGPQGKEKEKGEKEPPGQLQKGRSIFQTEEKAGGEHGGGEHGGGEKPKAEHGEKPKEAEHGAEDKAKADDHADKGAEGHGGEAGGREGGHAAEQDFQDRENQFAQDRKNRYAPGGYFRFDGMPAGITPEKINDAWQKVQGILADLDKRKQALDLRERELRELADDISRRQAELGKEHRALEDLQKQVDDRIEKFKEQVKLVRTDEVASLKRNAATLASFEPAKAAQIVTEQWKTEAGQDELLKMFEFMDKDAVNTILGALPNQTIQDVLRKRLKVSKETPAGGGSK